MYTWKWDVRKLGANWYVVNTEWRMTDVIFCASEQHAQRVAEVLNNTQPIIVVGA